MAKIVGLEGAEANFRWVVRPGSDLADSASVRDARMQLVVARTGLEARAKELIDPGLRARVLAYVTQDENEDKALQSASTDPETFDAARAATVSAYLDAQDAVSEAMRALDDPPPGTAER
jgi:hypothetical protein